MNDLEITHYTIHPSLREKWNWYKWFYFQNKDPNKFYYYKEPWPRKEGSEWKSRFPKKIES